MSSTILLNDKTSVEYKQYVDSFRSEPNSQVQKTKAFFEKDAFVEQPAPKSYDGKHSLRECTNFHTAAQFWTDRVNNNG